MLGNLGEQRAAHKVILFCCKFQGCRIEKESGKHYGDVWTHRLVLGQVEPKRQPESRRQIEPP